MRKLVLSMLIVTALTPAPVMAAAAVNKPPGAVPAAADDLIRRIERDLDRLTRGLNSDVAHIEKKRQPTVAPATGSSPLIRP
jgi:hypothetical protein